MKLSEFRKLIAEEIRYVLAAKSTVRNFNKSLNEAGSKLSTEQTYLSVLMEYLLDEFDAKITLSICHTLWFRFVITKLFI